MTLQIEEILRDLVGQGASDLHLKAGSRPGFRIDGHIIRQDRYEELTAEDTETIALQLMGSSRREQFKTERDLDFSRSFTDIARFRVNVLNQRGSVAIVLRHVPDSIPSAAELELPEVCMDLALRPRGLVLVTGPTGSGKSTTLAAMLNHVNENLDGHILTIEDPLEFIHPDKRCMVTQRQIGDDCDSFAQALRRALRQDPDVIMIGEMRDLETISNAVSAAETGHIVLGTLHTTGAISTVDRIIDVFPSDAQKQIRIQLAGVLQGVISQSLIPKVGGGRVAAREILVANDAVRSLIRDGKTPQLLNQLQTGKAQGMTTLETSLINMVKAGKITADDAIAKANRREEVEKHVGGAQSTWAGDVMDDFNGSAAATSSRSNGSAEMDEEAIARVRSRFAKK